MQLGLSSYTYGWAISQNKLNTGGLNELELIERALLFNLSLVQVGDNLPVHSFSPERLHVFKLALQEGNIKIELGARGLTAEHLRTYLGLCEHLGAGILRFVIDDETYAPSVQEVSGILRSHVRVFEDRNIVLAIENHDRFKAEEFADIVGEINSPFVGICLDTVNSIGAGEGFETVIQHLAPLTANLHIKDFGIQRLPHKQGFLIDGRIAGEGMLDIPLLVKTIRSFKRCTTCVLEQWVPPEAGIMDTISKEELWARKGIEYVKNVLEH
ncbi:MAG TPA: TIM barrel protein [Chitinophagaceae bacterium]|jgi:sugar phosphate isomerase/epimerase|nr:TIM barrel protein [Chitinophagaceae bacterium]